MLSLPPRPHTVFDVQSDDDVRALSMRVIQYSRHHAVELFGGNLVEEEECRDKEEAGGDEEAPEPQ